MAQNFTWIGATDGNWNTGTNWNNGVPTSAIDTALLFDSAIQPNTNNDILGLTLNSLTVGENSSGREFRGNTLTFDGGGATLRSLTTADNVLIYNDIHLNQSVEIEGGRNLDAQLLLGGDISGAGGLTFKDGLSTLTGGVTIVGGKTSTFTGAVVVRSGATLGVSTQGALGNASSVTIESGAALQLITDSISEFIGPFIDRSLNISGTGNAIQGCALAAAGGHSGGWSGAVTLQGDTVMGAFGDSHLSLTGGIDLGSHELTLQTKDASDSISVGGTISGNGDILLRTDGSNGGRITLGNVSGNGTLEVDMGVGGGNLASATMAGNLIGNRDIHLNSGLLVLTGPANTFTGSIVASGADSELRISDSSRLGNAANTVTLQNGGHLNFSSSGTMERAIHIDGGGMLTGNFIDVFSGFTSLIHTGDITGTGGLEVGVGSHTLSGNNTFTGGLRIAGTTVRYTDETNLGAAGEAVSLVFTGSLILPTPVTDFTRPIEVRDSTSNSPGSLAFEAGTVGRAVTISSDITGDGWLSLGGRAAVWTLTGDNTFSGGLKVSGQSGDPTTIVASSAENLGGASAGLVLGSESVSFQPSVVLRATGDLNFASTRATTYQGLAVDTNGHTVTFNQPLTGTGGLRKNGEGELVINNGGNNMTGQLRITGGSVRLGAENAFGATGPSVRLDSGTSLDIGGHNQRVTSIAGDFDTELHLGAGTLTLGSGYMYGDISGSGGLVLEGGSEFFPSSLHLGGNNTFTGGIISREFTQIRVQSANALGAPGNSITLDNGGIQVSNLLATPLIFSEATNLTIGSGGGRFSAEGQSIIIESALGGSGPVRFRGGSGIDEVGKYDVRLLNSANTFTGDIQLGDADNYAFSPVVIGIVSDGSLGNAANVLTLGDSFNNGEGGDLPAQGGLRAYADLTLLASRTIQLDGSSDEVESSGGFIDTNGHTVAVESTISELSSGMQLIKTGSGTLLLEGQNTYSGITDIREGTLGGGGAIIGDLSLANDTALTPGSSAGLFTVGGNLQSFGSEFEFELGGTARGTGYDGLDVGGTVDLTQGMSFLSITFLASFQDTIQAADTFFLIDADSFSGSFANIANGERLTTTDGFGSFVVNYGSGSAFTPNSVVISDFMAIPEPSTGGMVLGALVAALAFGRSRKLSN